MDSPIKVPPADQLHASAIQFLLDGGDEKAANILLSCNTIFDYRRNSIAGIVADITLRAPRPIYDLLTKAFFTEIST
jgi:hypothetical protein